MDRKQFLGTTLSAGAGCCVAALLARAGMAHADEAAGPPCDGKIDFVRGWVQDFMAQMDAQLDQATRDRLMEANGRACFTGALASGFYGSSADKKPAAPPPDLEAWFAGFQKAVGPERLYREGDVIHFKYSQNPRGLRVADGYCLCPILEDGPRQLSPTYCHCSVGYVSASFEHYSGRKVKVELVDSLRRGGKECHFAARFVAA
jgi:hypothetical protein